MIATLLLVAHAALSPIVSSAVQRAPQQQQATAAADSMALVRDVRDRVFHFMMRWRYEWGLSQRDLAPPRVPCEKRVHYARAMDEVRGGCPRTVIPPRLEIPTTLCGVEPIFAPGLNRSGDGVGRFGSAHSIGNRKNLNAKGIWCLTWPIPIDTEPPYRLLPEETHSEVDQIDLSLSQNRLLAISKTRAVLLAFLDSAARVLPGDPLIAGQRVRMYVDNGSYARAESAARQCAAAKGWCTALLGYAQYRAKEFGKASETYAAAVEAMAWEEHCDWSDLALLLPYAARLEYEAKSCGEREPINDRMWWLADPLWIEPGNERRTEHFVRMTTIALAEAIDVDERIDWRPQYEGALAKQMYIRYGRPSYWTGSAFLPAEIDEAMQAAADADADPIPEQPHPWRRFDTRSLNLTAGARPIYPGPQYHTIPTWRAINDPLSATDEDWDLGPPRDEDGLWDYSWWPVEFYRRVKGPFLPLEHQIAFLRRQRSILLASHVQWDSAWMTTGAPRSVVGGVAVTAHPDDMRIVSSPMDGRAPRPYLTPIRSERAIVGLEMVAVGMGPAARTRFGISPPATLSAFVPGDIALSDPILVRAGPDDDPPANIDAALLRMFGSTRLRNPSRIAVFWEVYGLSPSDTVDGAIKMIRHDDSNIFQRLGGLMGIGGGGLDSLSISWREPGRGAPAPRPEGTATISPRGITVDLSQLASGSYTLELTVTRAGTAPAKARRTLLIERPR